MPTHLFRCRLPDDFVYVNSIQGSHLFRQVKGLSKEVKLYSVEELYVAF